MTPERPGIHPTAVVAEGAEIGKDVRIGPYCVVGPRVRIGDGCILHSHVVLDGDTTLGERNELFPFAALGARPQDKKLTEKTPVGALRIGSGNQIREYVTIHPGTPFGKGVTVLGDNNMLLAASHIGHDAIVGNNVVFTNGAMAAGHSTVGDRAILGAVCGIHQYARVGALAMVGAGAMVSRDVPPYALVQGDRARLVGLNLVGLRRSGLPSESIIRLKRAFRLLFWRTGSIHDRSAAVRESLGTDPLVREMLDFVEDSKRGVVVPRGRVGPTDELELAEH